MKRSDDLRAQLQSWGFYQVNRYSDYRAPDDEPAEENPISRARAFAPMTRENVAKQLIGRDGRSRRCLMARQLYDERSGAQILDIVPTWACDPMPARNDADPPVDRRTEDGAAADNGGRRMISGGLTGPLLRWIGAGTRRSAPWSSGRNSAVLAPRLKRLPPSQRSTGEA